MVPNARLELARPFGHNHLKVACLPIPPAGHWITSFLVRDFDVSRSVFLLFCLGLVLLHFFLVLSSRLYFILC